MADALSDDQISSLRETFALFDEDGNGEITVDELGKVMQSLGLKPSASELQDMMNEIDVDSSGSIDFSEFATMMAQKVKKADSDAELREAFKVFDRDNSGTIDADELRHIMKSIGEDLTDEQIDDMVREADKDGDGLIDYNEFVQLMK